MDIKKLIMGLYVSSIFGNIANFSNRASNMLKDVQYKNLAIDNPALYEELEQSRQLGNLRRLELEQRQAERTAEIERQKMLGNVLRSPAGQDYMRKIGLPAEIAPAIGSISDIQALGRLSAPEDMGATGALVKRVMQDNPGMTFSDALAQVQTGFRRGVTFQGGTVNPIQGYGTSLGTIGGQEAYGTKQGELAARMEDEPALTEAIQAAKIRGGGDITPKEQMEIDFNKAKDVGQLAILSESDNLSNINTVVDRLKNNANVWTTGFLGKSGSFLPGTPQADFAQDLRTVLSDSALSTLSDLKKSSDTGASGLGALSEGELKLLISSKAAVEQSQSPEQFIKNITRYQEVRNKAFNRTKDFYQKRFGELPSELVPTGQSINNNVFNSVQEAEAANLVFNSIQEAEAASANMPDRTIVTIGGKKFEWRK